MAISYDSANSSQGASNPQAHSHTCAADATILVVGVQLVYSGLGAPTVTASYNLSAMTQVATVSPTGFYLYLFYIMSPSSGTNNVVVSASGFGTVTTWMIGSVSYKGVSSTPGKSDSNTASSTNTISQGLVTSGANSWITYTVAARNATALATWSPGSSETERYDHNYQYGARPTYYLAHAGGDESCGAAGSYTIQQTSSQTETALGIIVFEMREAAVSTVIRDIIQPGGVIPFAR